MSRRRFQIPTKRSQTFGLNVTSMTDMFTVLLIFLLQNYSTNEVTLDAVKDVRLPSSTTEKNPIDGAKLSISATELKFDQKVLANLNSNNFDKASIDPNDSNFIKPLFDELQNFNKKNEKLAKTGKVLLQADEALPYNVIRKVMYTASMAGFPNLKLITTAGQ
jgi:biopolymer transport protein ExbD